MGITILRRRRGSEQDGPRGRGVSAPGMFVFITFTAAGVGAAVLMNYPGPAIAGALIGIYFLFAIQVAEQWEKAARRVRREIGDRHFAGCQQGGNRREQADRHQRTAHQFHNAADPGHRSELQIVERRDVRELKVLGEAVLDEQQSCHDAQQTKNPRRPNRASLIHHREVSLARSVPDP